MSTQPCIHIASGPLHGSKYDKSGIQIDWKTYIGIDSTTTIFDNKAFDMIRAALVRFTQILYLGPWSVQGYAIRRI
jgi:hypothetical protein